MLNTNHNTNPVAIAVVWLIKRFGELTSPRVDEFVQLCKLLQILYIEIIYSKFLN